MLLSRAVITVIILFVSLALLSFVFKSIFKAIVIAIIITFLFRIGFLWTTDDLRDTKFFNMLNPETQEKVERFYNDYSAKRDSHSILNKEKFEYYK